MRFQTIRQKKNMKWKTHHTVAVKSLTYILFGICELNFLR